MKLAGESRLKKCLQKQILHQHDADETMKIMKKFIKNKVKKKHYEL